MQPEPIPTDERVVEVTTPAESLARHLPWLVLLALGGITLLLALLAQSTYSVATVLAPDRGGVFREGIAGAPQYLSPIWCQDDNVDRDLCALIFRGLTRIDKNGRIVPDLAASWEMVDDKTYVFHLQPEQFWHDGRPVTADDVLFSVGVLQDPTLLDIPGVPSFWRTVGVTKVDDQTVQFTLPQPFAPFLDYTTIGLLPQHVYGNTPAKELVTQPLGDQPVGAGPMHVVARTADSLRLEPSPFWAGAMPFIDALEFRFYPDFPSVYAAFEAGAIDGVSRILPQEIKAAAGRDDIQLFSSVEAGYDGIFFNLTNQNTPFFQDKRVRQALLYGVDRASITAEVLDGQGIVADSLITPQNWAYNPDVPKYAYDPARAAALLDEAGWRDSDGDGVRDKDGNPLRFVLLVEDDNLHRQIGERIRQDWGPIGIAAEVTPVSFAGMVTDFLAPRTFEAVLTNWDQLGDPDPYPQWHSTQIGAGQNYTGWQNEQADALMEKARAMSDEGERKQLYQEFQTLFAEELPALPLFYPVYTYGVSTRVHNVQIGALNTPAERFAGFRDWYIDSRRIPASQAPANAPPTPPGATPGLEE